MSAIITKMINSSVPKREKKSLPRTSFTRSKEAEESKVRLIDISKSAKDTKPKLAPVNLKPKKSSRRRSYAVSVKNLKA